MNGVANGVYGGDLPNQINTPWIDFSEQSTIVGWSSFTTKRILYKLIGNIIFVSIELNGTSNSTSANFTLPFISRLLQFANTAAATDNTVGLGSGSADILANTNTVRLYKPTSTSISTFTLTWTASGTKAIYANMYFVI